MGQNPIATATRPLRNRYFLAADLLLIPLAAAIAFVLRLDLVGVAPYLDTMLVYGGLALAVKPVVFFVHGLYRRYWRYASIREFLVVTLATLVATTAVTLLVIAAAPLAWSFRPIPRSVPFLDWLVSLFLVGGIRFAARWSAEARVRTARNHSRLGASRTDRRVLVMGAGDAGAMIVREMKANPQLGLVPAGFVDDNPAKLGAVIHGVPVLGSREHIPGLVAERDIDELIIAMPTAPGRAIREVVSICREVHLPCRTIPGIYELISGQVSVRQVREVSIDDLLRRDPVRVGGREEQRFLEGAVVLVTGAGGSIGGELCRQIVTYNPARVVLLGHGENSIYNIVSQLRVALPTLAVQPVIADVRHERRLSALLRQTNPDVVFHAAAHKHVPLMECNVAEAVMNNVFGTRRLVDACAAGGVQRFILISTDKAVNPTSVMGATKRVAELVVQDAAKSTGRAYLTVRFGNVLGSRGSVVPLFQRQIASGGPVTVTHPDVRRYFMTIPEAVQLVIKAAGLGKGGEIFVLDMGEQVLVADLAAQLIKLSGLEPGRDIDITYIGLREGEKMGEELFTNLEAPRRTRHEKVLVAYGNSGWSNSKLIEHLRELEEITKKGEPERIRLKLMEIVPEYAPCPASSDGLPAGEQACQSVRSRDSLEGPGAVDPAAS
jgi:FlaA1/EpsC-like NDP-sugar epimerase